MALIYCHMREYDYKKITVIYTKFNVPLCHWSGQCPVTCVVGADRHHLPDRLEYALTVGK